jgi:hypothetical protein
MVGVMVIYITLAAEVNGTIEIDTWARATMVDEPHVK